MILGIGTDIVYVNRFVRMSKLSRNCLLTFFSEAELTAAKDSNNSYTLLPEKLATRFAAKEALFKALSATLIKLGYTQKTFSLRFLAQISSIEMTTWGVPFFQINWSALEQKIGQQLPSLSIHLSLSHEQEHAVAFVICEQIQP